MRILMARFGTLCLFWLMSAGLSFAQNPYYDHGTFPATGTLGTSAGMRAELDLIEAGFAKLPTLSGNANKIIVVNPGATALTATDAFIPSGAAFPASPSLYSLFISTDDSASGECDSAGGSARTICMWDGSAWVTIDTSGVTGWPSVNVAGGVTWANSFASAFKVGKDTSNYWALYHDPTDGLQFICVIAGVANDCNYIRKLANGKYWQVTDSLGNNILKLYPGGATPKDRYTIGYSGNYPLKSFWVGAGALYGDGTNCPSRPTAVTINSGPVIPTFICTDNDGSRLNGMVAMPPDWDGGTITLTHSYIQTAADTSALNGDVAAQCRGAGETVSSTWGTEVAIDDAAVTGSNANDLTTSAAVTPAGTCAAGDMLYFYYELDAAGTTTAAATLHHLGFRVTYSYTSLSN